MKALNFGSLNLDCMRRASMTSAISVMRAGAAPSIPQREEVKAALEERA